MIRFHRVLGMVLASAALSGAALSAQDPGNAVEGVRLGLIYETSYQPALAVKPFSSRFGGGGVETQAEVIIARDLRYSDRFTVLDSLPASLMGEGIDYQLWDQLGATWLLTGQVESLGDSYVLILALHDVVYGEVKEQERFPLPDPGAANFRMAVHRASDKVVEWVFQEPGMAASRIAFSRIQPDGSQEIYVVDSDGENMQRVTNYGDISMSPTWHPSGEKIAFATYPNDEASVIREMDLGTGRERTLGPGRSGQQITPAYSPNGREIAFGILEYNRTGLFSYDWERDCCLTHIQGGRWEDMSPAFSPDGSQVAFNSNRLGTGIPQVYVVSARGGQPRLISPYVPGGGGYYTSPDWSPNGDLIAFHGRIGRTGRYHILVAEVQARGPRVLRLTAEGNNEDPSWAPDGRHIVFAGERSYGFGLFVVDATTGRIRPLVSNIRPRNPDWSAALPAAADRALRGGGF